VSGPLLALEQVSVDYGPVSAVHDVSLEVSEGEIFGLVGESGCGKTTLALAVMGLLPRSAQVRGRIDFQGEDVLGLSEAARRRLRGDRISMVFQDPEAALDPAFAVGEQVAETIRAHRPMGGREARKRATQLLTEVGIPAAAKRYGDPPHRLSGGMQQRVVIATALANEPALLVADEPTTALDVMVQAQILQQLVQLSAELDLALVLVTHDLPVVAQVCDRAAVMYAGEVVETGPVDTLFHTPRHPYTRLLFAATPDLLGEAGAVASIPGSPPRLDRKLVGCPFRLRCDSAFEPCPDHRPELREIQPGHAAACHLNDRAWADAR
jgi:peptide/nickel transport system ATP-binding protein